jgi:hypothetical protein
MLEGNYDEMTPDEIYEVEEFKQVNIQENDPETEDDNDDDNIEKNHDEIQDEDKNI